MLLNRAWQITKYIICLIFVISIFIDPISKFIVEKYMLFKLRNQHIVVSFTTTPYRINQLAPTIKDLSDQNIHIDQIYLSVPFKFKRDNLEYTIPKYLQDNPNIKILRTADYGPATKLLGLLANVNLPKNTIIITIDDDTPYPSNLVLQLAYKIMKNPNQAVGLSGAIPDYDVNGLLNINNELGLIKINGHERYVSVLQGFAGIAYRAEFFEESIFDILNYPQSCIKSDDLYLSFYLARKNIKRTNLWNKDLNPSQLVWHNHISTADDSLHKVDWVATKYQECLAFMQNKYPGLNF